MKRFHLSPLTRQSIIFCLLALLLWSNKPTPGPDGLVEAEYQQYDVDYLHIITIPPGRYIDICLDKPPYQELVQDAILVSMSRNRRPAWARFLLTKLPWTSNLLPKKIRGAGFTVVVGIKPADWDKLEAAKRNGNQFRTEPVPKRFVGTGRRSD